MYKVVQRCTKLYKVVQRCTKLYKDVDTVADMKRKILEWIGHVARMDQGRVDKKIFDCKPEGRRGTLLVAHFVETLPYKLEGRGFDSR